MTANRDTLREGMRETVLQSLETGAPGLSAATRQAIARSIILKVEGRVLAPILDKADSADRAIELHEALADVLSAFEVSEMDGTVAIAPGRILGVTLMNAQGVLEDTRIGPLAEANADLKACAEAAEARADRLSAEVEALRGSNCRRTEAYRAAADALLATARRSSWEASQGTPEDRGFLMSHWHDGFNAAARARAGRAIDALDLMQILAPLSTEMASDLEAARTALARAAVKAETEGSDHG